MKVVILAFSVDEARGHARAAGVALSDVLIPSSARFAEGLKLDDADLIVELPSFARHPHRDQIEIAVRNSVRKSKGEPVWHKVGEGRS